LQILARVLCKVLQTGFASQSGRKSHRSLQTFADIPCKARSTGDSARSGAAKAKPVAAWHYFDIAASKTDQTAGAVRIMSCLRARRGAGPSREGLVAMGDKKQKPAKPGTKPIKK